MVSRPLQPCRDAEFREKFHAAIVSIRREGARLDGKMGDVVLRAGDELLFDCGSGFDATAASVAANLTDVNAVESAAGQEFMVPFEVLGALRAVLCTEVSDGFFRRVCCICGKSVGPMEVWASIMCSRSCYLALTPGSPHPQPFGASV